jgi:hypothetical protein
MPNQEHPGEQERLKALQAALDAFGAKYETMREERAGLLKEQDEHTEAALFASQHGELFADIYYDCIRHACEDTGIEAEILVRKLPPLTLDLLIKAGESRLPEQVREALTDEEFHVYGIANQIAIQILRKQMKKGSSNA